MITASDLKVGSIILYDDEDDGLIKATVESIDAEKEQFFMSDNGLTVQWELPFDDVSETVKKILY